MARATRKSLSATSTTAATSSSARTFEGILPNLERRYRETESATVREELAKFLSTQPCPDCHGTRLRREARNVLIGQDPRGGERHGQAIYEVEAMPLSTCLAWFREPDPDRPPWRDRRKRTSCKRDPRRA